VSSEAVSPTDVADALDAVDAADGREDPAQLAMFDLDHTLIRCDSFAGFARELLLRRWWRTGLILTLGPLVGPLWMSRRTRHLAGSILVWTATVGLSERAFHALMDRHAERRFAGGALTCEAAVARLREHQAEGARIVVVTGAVAALAQRVCAHIGIGDVEVVGSSLRRALGGFVSGDHCFGPRKVAMLVERGFPHPWAFVYTDSSTDLPLLRLAEQRRLVNPKPVCQTKVLAALGSSVEVIDWP